MKFSHKLASASGCLVLIALSALSYIQYKTTEKHLQSQMKSATHTLVKSVANSVDEKMISLEQSFKFTIQDLKGDFSRERVSETLSNPVLKDLYAIIAMGYASDGTPVSNDKSWEQKAIATHYDSRQRPWYKDAIKKGDVGFTEPYQDNFTKEYLISLFGPAVNQNNQTQGVFFADISLSFLNDLLNKVKVEKGTGHLFLVDKNNIIISHPNKEYIGKKLSVISPELKASSAEKTQHITLNGRDMVYEYKSLDYMPWYMVTEVDLGAAYQGLADISQQSIIFTIVTLIICVILILLLIKVLFKPLVALNNAIENLASGDANLTQRLDTNTDQEFAQVADGFNRFIGMLQHQIDETKQSSKRIRELSEQTIITGDHARKAVGTQQQELDQLATAMHEMSSTAHEVASNAQEASSATENARQATMEGSKIVGKNATISQNIAAKIKEASRLVHELEQSSMDIETVLDVINQISEQTNLLALNAAIEAARAGESGRGFAVVADEVRTLAQRTQASTTEIRDKIEHLQTNSKSVVTIMDESTKDVEVSVTVANEAHDELTSISDAITNATDLVMQIASAAEEQSSVSEEINVNTNNIKDLAMDVLASIETTTDQSKEQDQLVIFQEELLSRFKV